MALIKCNAARVRVEFSDGRRPLDLPVIDTGGRYPVNFSPMQCNFMIQLHNVDADYYDKFYVPGYITDRIRNQDATWH